jgi:hypothetical protein
LEQAAHAFDTGRLVKPGPFNHAYNALFKEYLNSINKFNHWDGFYAECSVSQAGRTPKSCKSTAADLSLVEIGCGDLHFSSSPVRD